MKAPRLIKPKDRPSQPTKLSEQNITQVEFTVHKLNNRPKPNKDRVVIVCCFSEFGCETLGSMYSIPRLLKRYRGRYVIAVGWYGRAYLYKHLVDEFWEIKPEYMWLRDYARAFHNASNNLLRLEQTLRQYGKLVPSSVLGQYSVGNYCITCGKFWHGWKAASEACPRCKSTYITRSNFSDIEKHKKTAVPLPKPCEEKMEWAKKLLPPKCVGIFARGRKTYGRNLGSDFYVKLIELIRSKGHEVIWLGEKQSTQLCPVEDVLDFSRMEDARDLEKTLAIICHLDFTVQFWTASTRLSGAMGTPFLLFESPEQIYCSGLIGGQEGKRLELTSFGPKKLVIAHYLSVVENVDLALQCVDRAVEEMSQDNWEDLIVEGVVNDVRAVRHLKKEHEEMLR